MKAIMRPGVIYKAYVKLNKGHVPIRMKVKRATKGPVKAGTPFGFIQDLTRPQVLVGPEKRATNADSSKWLHQVSYYEKLLSLHCSTATPDTLRVVMH
ncbi:hypothetical protein NDU88_000920 [Pleurodeles waltl]|uniref:Uncharacterized protein n=1 Tax=Pleurodeles waltl TaxID=8319 RepID=A0AAV7VYC1_PLEWA|nr:hypothetical protein NDU88_000920 [Pleurodeles waltl]